MILPNSSAWNEGISTFLDLLTPSQSPDLDAIVRRIYPGGWPEYESTYHALGITDDHIQNFINAGIILQPKQLEFIYWARYADGDDNPNEIGFGGSRGSGKSYVLFVQAAIDDCHRFPGLKVLYLRQTGKRAAEQMQDMVLSTLAHVTHQYAHGKVQFPNGSRMIIGHFQTEKEAMNYLGIEYDIIILEEATALPEKIYKHVRLANRSSKGFRPRIYNSTNPMGIGHTWYKKRFIDPERRGESLSLKRKFIFATVDDNLFINPEYVESLDDLKGVEHRAYRHGDWDIVAGAYHEAWNYDLHTIPPTNRIPPDARIWGAIDYGFQHWNAILFCFEDGDGNLCVFHELAHRKRYPVEIAADIKTALEGYGLTLDQLETFLVGNDAFNETGINKRSIAKQYADEGIFLSRADVSPGSRVLSARYIDRLLGNPERNIPQQLWITQNCPMVIDQLPNMQRDPNNIEAPLKVDSDDNGEGGDDHYDCLRYLLYRPSRTSISSLR